MFHKTCLEINFSDTREGLWTISYSLLPLPPQKLRPYDETEMYIITDSSSLACLVYIFPSLAANGIVHLALSQKPATVIAPALLAPMPVSISRD